MNITELVQRGATIKSQIKALQDELVAIDTQVATQAEFKPGSKTGHLGVEGVKVTVSLRDNVKWHQDRLHQVRTHMVDLFDTAFKIEWKPDAKAVELAAAKSEDFAKAIEWAREIKPGKPTVSYELTNDIPF